MKVTTAVTTVALAVIAVTGAGVVQAQAVDTNAPAVSGAIRCSHGKWSVIKDAAHTPHGITKIVPSATYITVYHTNLGTVGSMQSTADLDYNTAGISVGASVGETYSRINFVKDGRVLNPSKQACQAWTNVWVTAWKG